MLEQVAVEERLTLLAEPDQRVKVGPCPRRRHRPQELDVTRRHIHVDHEVGAREREENADPLLLEHDRVERKLPVLVVEDGDDERQLFVPVHDLAEHVGRLVPVEGRAEHLDLVVRLEVRPRLTERPQEQVDVALEVAEGPAPAEVAEEPREALPLPVDVRVVAAVDRRVGGDLLRRDGGADEDEVVVRVGAVQDSRDHRVEERLGELGLVVVDQEPDEAELDLPPRGGVELVEFELCAQPLHVLADTFVVEADSLLHRQLRLGPRRALEPPLGLRARLSEEPVVLIEALEQDGCDSLSDRFPFHQQKVGE